MIKPNQNAMCEAHFSLSKNVLLFYCCVIGVSGSVSLTDSFTF